MPESVAIGHVRRAQTRVTTLWMNQEPCGRNDEHEHHRPEGEGVAVVAELERQVGLQRDGDDPEEEAAEHGAARLPMPPSTVAMNATSTGVHADRRLDDPRLLHAGSRGRAASRPLSAKAVAITVFARTPSRRAIRKSSAAARICTPIRVCARNSPSAASSTEGDDDGDDVEVRDREAADRERLRSRNGQRSTPAAGRRRQDRQVLQQVADRERGDEQRVGVGAADRTEGDPLHRSAQRRPPAIRGRAAMPRARAGCREARAP